jgi:hypothetical protein
MILVLVLAACTGDPQVDDTDSDTAVGDCPTGTAWFQGSEGDPSDVTSELDALTLDQDGTLTFCGGEHAVQLDVSANVTLRTDPAFDRAVLTAANDTHVYLTKSGIDLTVEDLDFTGGNNCWASAILGAVVSECDRLEFEPITADIVLRRTHMYGNTFDTGGGVVAITGDTTLTLEESFISDNEGHGIFAVNANMVCTNGGVHDNTKTGIWSVQNEDAAGTYTIDSTSCDWSGAGYNSVILDFDQAITFDFGEDATFACDSGSQSCG